MITSLPTALAQILAVCPPGHSGVEANGGIFSCGVAAGPLDVSLSVQSATAAALKAVQAVRTA